MTAGLVTAAVIVAGLTALYRARRVDARQLAAWKRRQRTADQVLDDVRAWRSARDLDTCRAIWSDAPFFMPQQRKESGQ